MFRAARGCQNSRLESTYPWISLIATTLLVAFSIKKAVSDGQQIEPIRQSPESAAIACR